MKTFRNIIIAVCLLVGIAIILGFITINQRVTVTETTRIYIPSDSNYPALLDTLDAHHCLRSYTIFGTLAQLRGLPKHVKTGSYRITPNMRIISLVQKLYSGNQDPIRITINKYRTLDALCQHFGSKLMFDADSLLVLLTDSAFCAQYNLTPRTIIGLFPQNTYEFYWTTTPTSLVARMNTEYEHFWQERDNQLPSLGLTRSQVLTIASIVEEETNCNEEKADIASVYLNRYRIGMPLQADPTVKYAVADFTIRRIKGDMLKCDSPYNTYLHAGLPPGPICIPSAASIDAVLKNHKTDYLYFCAKEDFSGRHNFAATAEQHIANARKFHKALNERNIH